MLDLKTSCVKSLPLNLQEVLLMATTFYNTYDIDGERFWYTYITLRHNEKMNSCVDGIAIFLEVVNV